MIDGPAILILAAGASSRMRGRDKLLEPVGGEPVLRRLARLALETGCAAIVTLPPGRPDRRAALDGLAIHRITIDDAPIGMSASLRGGLDFARTIRPAMHGLMVLPADMPDFTLAALQTVIAAFRDDPGRIVRGTTETGQPGHPVIFPRDLWAALAAAAGDRGGRDVLEANAARVQHVALPGRMAVTDLDTPEDWAAWRASGGVA